MDIIVSNRMKRMAWQEEEFKQKGPTKEDKRSRFVVQRISQALRNRVSGLIIIKVLIMLLNQLPLPTGDKIQFYRFHPSIAQKTPRQVFLCFKCSIVYLESHWTPLSFIRDASYQFYIFKSNMPQLMRTTHGNATNSTVVKVTPEQLMALMRQGKTGLLKASTLTLTDSGEHIIRPVLLPLSH